MEELQTSLFEIIPRDVFLSILMEVDLKTLQCSANIVCKYWNGFTGSDGIFWKLYCTRDLSEEELRTAEGSSCNWKMLSSPRGRSIFLLLELLQNTKSELGNVLYQSLFFVYGRGDFGRATERWILKEKPEITEPEGLDSLLIPFYPIRLGRYRKKCESWVTHKSPWRNLLRKAANILGPEWNLGIHLDEWNKPTDLTEGPNERHGHNIKCSEQTMQKRREIDIGHIITPLVELLRKKYRFTVVLSEEIVQCCRMEDSPANNTRSHPSRREVDGAKKRKIYMHTEMMLRFPFMAHLSPSECKPEISKAMVGCDGYTRVIGNLSHYVDLFKLDAWTHFYSTFREENIYKDPSMFVRAESPIILLAEEFSAEPISVFGSGKLIFSFPNGTAVSQDQLDENFRVVKEEIERTGNTI